jgi:hypothetical protein
MNLFHHATEQGEQVNHTDRSARTPSRRTGFFAALGALLRDAGGSAPATNERQTTEVRRPQKAPAVRPTLDAGSSRARSSRLVAMPAAFGDFDRSGASSHRRLAGLIAALAILAAAVLLPAAAPAANYEFSETTPSICSGTGAGAEECGELKGIAVDQSNGNIYVVDQTNLRVNQFAPNGNFVRAFGADVVASGQHNNGATNAEVCEPSTSAPVDVCKAGASTASLPGALAPSARGIAVDPVSHVVFVSSSESRLAYFNGSTGAFLGQTQGKESAAPGVNTGAPEKFAQVTGVAVDSSDPLHHYLYVAINVNAQSKTLVDKFETSASGLFETSYQCQITGTATATSVNSTECGGNGLPAHRDGKFEGIAMGTTATEQIPGTGSFTNGSQQGGNLSVDPNGNVFLAEGVWSTAKRNVISEFSSAGSFVTQFTPAVLGHPTEPRPEAVATLPNGKILIADDGALVQKGGSVVQEFNPTTIAPATPPNVTLASPLSEITLPTSPSVGASLGLATNASGDVYVADRANKKIWHYQIGVPGPPKIKEQEASSSPVTAELKAKVHTGNLNLTNCHFEYVTQAAFAATGFTDLSSGGQVGCSPSAASIANDGQYHAVSAQVEDLTPSTAYRWRAVATNVEGTTSGASETFTSGAAGPPTVESQALGALTATTAELKATVNPHFAEVNAANSHFFGIKDCRFEYTTDPSFHDGIQATLCQTPSNLGKLGAGVPTKSTVTGLSPNTKYYWRIYAANAEGFVEGVVQNFTSNFEAATVATKPVGALGETSAELRGEVDNHGTPLGSTCEFQLTLAADTSYASPVQTLPCSPNPVTGTGASAVSASATGLAPNTSYIYRVRAKNQGNEQAGTGFAAGASQPFTTSQIPTLIQGILAVGEDSATVAARINPNGLPTTYHVEYVEEATYQADQPNGFEHATQTAESSSVGADRTTHEVTAELAGLSPGKVYRYRFLAHNANGDSIGDSRRLFTRSPIEQSCGNDALRQENDSTALPDCRAYEMVTPVDKSFGNVDGSAAAGGMAAWDGNSAGFCTDAQFGEEPPQNTVICVNYVSHRYDTGWRTRTLVPRYCSVNLETSEVGKSFETLSANMGDAVFNRPEASECTAHPPLAPHSPALGEYLYHSDLTAEPASYELLSPESASPAGYDRPTGLYIGASRDYDHIIYRSTGAQAPGAIAGAQNLFDWHDGSIDLVNWQPGNAGLVANAVVPYASDPGQGAASDSVNAVSESGSRVFFQGPKTSFGEECSNATCDLYLREGGSTTYWVSEQECSPACPNQAAADKFEWATRDGSKAFFSTSAKLNNEDTSATGSDLYMFAKGPAPSSEQNLTLLSKDGEPAGGSEAKVVGIVGLSDDGNTVYFVAEGQLVAGKTTAPGPKLYRWRWNGGSPTLSYLASLDPPIPGGGGDEQNWSGGTGGSPSGKPITDQVTADGQKVLIETFRQLDPVVDRDANTDVYLWDEEEWLCLSCQAPGSPSAGESGFDRHKANFYDKANILKRVTADVGLTMSDDGSDVFFVSKDSLLPEDVNGLPDAYQWHEGVLRLITTGAGNQGFGLIGTSESGDDFFFVTSQQLVGWDTDGNTDFYDARVGGGFASPPPAAVACEGDACRDGASQAGPETGVGSATFAGSGNPPPSSRACRKPKVRRAGKCVRRHKKSRRHRARGKHSIKKGR